MALSPRAADLQWQPGGRRRTQTEKQNGDVRLFRKCLSYVPSRITGPVHIVEAPTGAATCPHAVVVRFTLCVHTLWYNH